MKKSHIAHEAQARLPGMSEVNLESCQGVPDQHSRFGTMDILIYAATSASSDSYSLPVVGGISFSNSAYCQAIFGLKNGCVTHIIYFADTNATGHRMPIAHRSCGRAWPIWGTRWLPGRSDRRHGVSSSGGGGTALSGEIASRTEEVKPLSFRSITRSPGWL